MGLPKKDSTNRASLPFTAVEAPRVPRPEPPGWLDEDEVARWDEMWSSPAGETWHPVLDRGVVEDWFRLRREIAADPGRGTLHTACRQVEKELGLTPRARLLLRIDLVEPAAAPEATAPVTDPRIRSVG